MGEPKIEIDPEQVAQLAKRLWTKRQIAAFFHVSEDTIHRRFAALIEENKALGAAYLIDLGWKRIQAGSDRMLERYLERFCDFKPANAQVNVSIEAPATQQEKLTEAKSKIDAMLEELKDVTPQPSLPKGLIPENR